MNYDLGIVEVLKVVGLGFWVKVGCEMILLWEGFKLALVVHPFYIDGKESLLGFLLGNKLWVDLRHWRRDWLQRSLLAAKLSFLRRGWISVRIGKSDRRIRLLLADWNLRILQHLAGALLFVLLGQLEDFRDVPFIILVKYMVLVLRLIGYLFDLFVLLLLRYDVLASGSYDLCLVDVEFVEIWFSLSQFREEDSG